MSLRRFICFELLLVIFLVLLFLTIDEVLVVVVNSYTRYLYFLLGGALMFVIDRFTYRNNKMMKTFHHESTHMLVSLLTFRKVLMLKVEPDSGAVASAGSKRMLEAVSLSPYCFPLFAYVVMIFGYFFGRDMVNIYAVILGAAYAFHLLCIKDDFVSLKVLGRHQTDINQYPLLFSYSYILSFWLFNTMIVLLSVRRDIVEAYLYIFDNFKQIVCSIF